MNKHRIFEIVCVAALLVFIVLVSRDSSYSDKTAQQMAEAVTQAMDVSELKKIKKNQIREDFGIDFSSVESFVYYASDEVMNVSELMLIKLKADVRSDEIKEKIEKRVKDKQTLFKGYAPEQSALLENYILSDEGGFIFYCVGEDAKQAHSAFKENIN